MIDYVIGGETMFKNKKFIVSLLFLALILIVSACGGGGDDGGSDTASDSGSDSGSESTDDGGATASGDVDNGAKVFKNNCMSCHGKEGAGGSGPSLQGNDFAANYDKVVKQVKNGGGGMPAFKGTLSEQEIADVATYITEKIAPMGK